MGRPVFVCCPAERAARRALDLFKLATPVAPQYDPERVVVAPERGLLFESEEALVPGWIAETPATKAAYYPNVTSCPEAWVPVPAS